MTERPIPAITGFNPFGNLPEEGTEAEDARKERDQAEALLDQHFLNTFTTKSGRAVFEYLTSRTEKTEGFAAELGLFNGIAWGFAREGQNSIIRHIRERMGRAMERRSK